MVVWYEIGKQEKSHWDAGTKPKTPGGKTRLTKGVTRAQKKKGKSHN